jgi:TonB family protein
MGYLGPSLRRAKRIERPLRRVALAVLASLALNAAIFLVLIALGAFQVPAPAQQTRVALAPLSSSQWEANRAVAKGAPPPPPTAAQPAQPPRPPPDEHLNGKVVELNPNQKAAEKPPPNTRNLSDRNSQVDRETVSRFAGNYARVAPKPEEGQEGKATAPKPPPKPKSAPDVKPGGTDEGKAGKEGAPGERVAIANPGEGTRSLREPHLGENGQEGRPGAAPDLSVPPEALARIAGGPNMDGAHEGLPEGDETWLNAREFKYATFMNRMRSDIAKQWYPMVRDATKQRDPDGSVYFYRERTVVLSLVLDTSGNVKDMAVKQSSNVEFFDRIAMTSVRNAQPFPNPPSGMFHGDEQVTIPFSFTMFPGDHRGLLFWRPPSE